MKDLPREAYTGMVCVVTAGEHCCFSASLLQSRESPEGSWLTELIPETNQKGGWASTERHVALASVVDWHRYLNSRTDLTSRQNRASRFDQVDVDPQEGPYLSLPIQSLPVLASAHESLVLWRRQAARERPRHCGEWAGTMPRSQARSSSKGPCRDWDRGGGGVYLES